MKQTLKNIIPPFIGNILKKSWLRIRGYYYAGDTYRCPVCKHGFRYMLPGGFDLPIIREKEIVGAGYRENDICPLCQSTDRDRLVFLYLKHQTNLFDRSCSMLHMAPEPSLYRVFKKLKNLHYFPVTKYQEGFYYDSNLQSADLLDLAFEGETFDWVICNHVLEHIDDDKKAMTEIFRVLKPGGKAILQVPISFSIKKTYENNSITDPREREQHFGQFDHVRIYGLDYVERLSSAGFEVTVISQEDDFSNLSDTSKYALNPKEKLFLCTKPDYKSHQL